MPTPDRSGHELDLTPDPKVLIALTHTPLRPLDALCELIDNAIDGFTQAQLDGAPVRFPLVSVELPGLAEVGRGDGMVRIRDNGPGLSAAQAEKALRAGYSGNNPFDRLGLFGMGFNISTGKIGEVTRFLTARSADDFALEVQVDLQAMQEVGSYRVPTRQVEKPEGFNHGTIIEVRRWWPEGNQNSGFIRKLAGYPKKTVRETLGRRYATLLRERDVRITVNNEAVDAFEHCVWGRDRFVEVRGRGRIPAVFDIDERLGHQTRCSQCWALVPAATAQCPDCGASSFRTIEERVRGWVGIQRFDDKTHFGIDLIRNGRAIRIEEKVAFFEFTNELGDTVKDYPIDSPFGRIIGEIHLDHVPVDFLKRDFQRTSDEWDRAISLLRGTSSLQPQQPGADANDSYIFKLFQGYRRVRKIGRGDMYMGYWDTGTDKPARIGRDVEQDYYERFLQRERGYYDDEEWWRLVEQAEQPPLEELTECPNGECGAENPSGAELCQVCGAVIRGKPCINEACETLLPESAVSCDLCGTSQVPDVEEPWRCNVCGAVNDEVDEACLACSKPRGTPHPASVNALLGQSRRNDELSIDDLSIELADGSQSDPLSVDVFLTTDSIVPGWQRPAVPVRVDRSERVLVFVDPAHSLFRTFGLRPETLVATEIAQYIYELHRAQLHAAQSGAHSVSAIAGAIMTKYWRDRLEDGPGRIRSDISDLFQTIAERLADSAAEGAAEFFGELTEDEHRELASNMIEQGLDIARLGELKQSGAWLRYVGRSTIVGLFRSSPGLFFDGVVWSDSFADAPDLPAAALDEARKQTKAKFQNCLEDASSFFSYAQPDRLTSARARASVEFLSRQLA